MSLPADTSLAPMIPDTTRNMNRRYQLFSQYILALYCLSSCPPCLPGSCLLQNPAGTQECSPLAALGPGPAQITGAWTGPHAMMGTDWSQESSEQVLRNTRLTARREQSYSLRAYTAGRLHNSQNVGSQTGAARSFAARQTEQL